MRKAILLSLAAASVSLAGCATDGYYSQRDRQLERAATGAALGAAAGAAVGAAVDGVTPVEGAAVGAIAGGAIGAATSNNRDWHRDSRGYCFYYDRYGERIYDYDRRC